MVFLIAFAAQYIENKISRLGRISVKKIFGSALIFLIRFVKNANMHLEDVLRPHPSFLPNYVRCIYNSDKKAIFIRGG